MTKRGAYFLGILTGVVITIAIAFVYYKIHLSSGNLSMFDVRGQKMEATAYTILHTYDETHALAIDSHEYELSAFINLPSTYYNIVYIIGGEGSHFYDGLKAQSSGNYCFYQVGTYRYKTQDGEVKTIPAVMLMKKK